MGRFGARLSSGSCVASLCTISAGSANEAAEKVDLAKAVERQQKMAAHEEDD